MWLTGQASLHVCPFHAQLRCPSTAPPLRRVVLWELLTFEVPWGASNAWQVRTHGPAVAALRLRSTGCGAATLALRQALGAVPASSAC